MPVETPAEAAPGDRACGDGAVRARSQEAGFELVAKVPVQPEPEGRFPKRQFNVDLAANSWTGPAGHSTFEVRPVGWR